MPMYVDRKENLLYLDNRGVRVTKTWLRVGNATYAIGNITSYTTGESPPGYVGPALSAFTGLVIAIFGLETSSWIAVGAGALFIAMAIGWGVSRKPHYFLRIVSTGTESRPVRAKDRAYVESIIAAIRKAKLQQE
jgi:hypothetical protein